MATRDSDEFQQHPLVEALVPDPAQPPPSTTVLVGYLGNGTSPEVKRLYLSDQLDEWLEFPTEAILYRRDLPGDAGTQVWVPQTTSLERHNRAAESVEARFLSGGIADEFGLGLQQFGLGQEPPHRLEFPSDVVPCATVSGLRWPTTTIRCPTEFGPRCPTTTIRCPTEFGPRCPTTQTQTNCLPCPTRDLPCPTETRTDCIPCPTQTRTDCIPCPTRQTRTDCLPCPTEFGPRCPTGPIGCPTNVLRCRTRPEECF